jgi:hypothetical protein
MAKFTDLPPEVRQKILAYVLNPSQIADIKLSVNHTSALTLSQVSHQFRADATVVHAAWRKEHTLESFLSAEWNDEGLEMSRRVNKITSKWRERQVLNDGESRANDGLDMALEEGRVIAVLDWMRMYMVHLRARGFEQKQRNKELEQHMQVQREVLLECREECERLKLQVKVLGEGLDRITLD